MRPRFYFWALVSIACFIGAFYFWRLGEQSRLQSQKKAESEGAAVTERTIVRSSVTSASTSPMAQFAKSGAHSQKAETNRMAYRLSNTSRPLKELATSDQAILLENALIDTSTSADLTIPDVWKSKDDPGTYLVQARGPVDDAFRARLQNAGVEIISYIPNNAYLVRASAGVANSIPGVQRVLPWEPYYKVAASFLQSDKPLQADQPLNILLFSDAAAEGMEALIASGGTVLAQSPSPFGTMVTATGFTDLPKLASLPAVQRIEPASPRQRAVDLTRQTMGIAFDSVVPTNYLGLTGSNVMVGVIDSGIDTNHPALIGRVFGITTNDTVGHGTHVAGIIGGNGANSTSVTNASGSILPPVDGQFRGMAANASLFALPIDEAYTDYELQTTFARATNALISNNSWSYSGQTYDIAAANYDAAVRDALPDRTNSQPLVFVFAAGNSGNGADSGSASGFGSIFSPATAKNVITVGALEQLRNITNETEIVELGETNKYTPWKTMTDSSSQVARFSSRGNVGVDTEGEFGRFKPDVVAPGVFVISTRSEEWDEAAYYNPTNYHVEVFRERVKVGAINGYPLDLPYNTVEPVTVTADAIFPDVDLPIYYRREGGAPTPTTYDILVTNHLSLTSGQFGPVPAMRDYGIGNPTTRSVLYEVTTLIATTNDEGNALIVLSNMNNSLGGFYRYESGTSMAAPAVSGMLALMQEYFTNQVKMIPSPALMKALLINGARTVNASYDLQVRKTLNDQGWGLPNLANSLPRAITNGASTSPGTTAAMIYFEQDSTNALATGESRTYTIQVRDDATNQPLRVTLVWTDPPGNPAAGIKLVNDLDLVVTNLDSTTSEEGPLIYFGNDIPAGASFTFPWDTNSPPTRDFVNNVENVFLLDPLGSRYSITVKANRVNANAVTANTNKVVQDFALVISSGEGVLSNAISITLPSTNFVAPFIEPTIVTNDFGDSSDISGQLLLNQHVGANSPLLSRGSISVGTNTIWSTNGLNGQITLGTSNQWHFYVVTNTTTYTNAAFAVFLPPTLSVPRLGVTNYGQTLEATRVEADIDMYVLKNDPRLLTLDPTAMALADKAVGRKGTELIVYSNAQPNDVYYVGVHAEDQQAAEYAFLAVFSLLPFDDGNGNMRCFPLPAFIPDGTPDDPRSVNIFGIYTQPALVRRVVVTNSMSHGRMVDLFGQLSHNGISVTLNNHSCPEDASGECLTNVQHFVYEDNGENDIPGALPTDGPGSLTEFIGEEGQGLWLLTQVDNAFGATGVVEFASIHLDPLPDLAEGAAINVQPESFYYAFVNVPPEATNLTVCVSSNAQALQLYVRRAELPTLADFDYTMAIPPGGDCLEIDKFSSPPLRPGRYYIGVYNPNASAVQAWLTAKVLLDTNGVPTIDFAMFGPQAIPDDSISHSSIHVPFDRLIARVDVGIAIEHPRISDLALALLSPSGKRILLSENRGGTSANMGSIAVSTNVIPFDSFNSGPNAVTNVIQLTNSSGVLVIDFDFLQAPDSLDIYYGTTNIYSTGLVSGKGSFSIPFGPGTATNLTIVVNQDNNPGNPGTAWQFTARVVTLQGSYFVFSDNDLVLSSNMPPKTKLPIKFAVPPFWGSDGIGALPPIPGGVSVVTGPVLNPANGHHYYLLDNSTWTQAEAWAVSLGGHLATVRNASEDAWLFNTFGSFGGVNRNLWIGLRDLAGDTTSNPAQHMTNFSWVSGENASYRNWYPGEPNNGGGGAYEYFGMIDFFYGGRWQDGVDDTVLAGKSEAQFGVAEIIVNTNSTYFFPEESLKDLVGDSAKGEWKLEMWDNRTGAVIPTPQLLSWQLRFIFDVPVESAEQLLHDFPVTNNIVPCQLAYYEVKIPSWAKFVTNTLISATAPVNVWANTNQLLPGNGGTNTGDFPLFLPQPATTGVGVLDVTNIPGGRYFVGIENPCGSPTNVTFIFKIEFDTTALSNGIPVVSTNLANVPRYFSFDVSTNATAVSFQLTNMTGNFDMVVHKGGPLPPDVPYHYGSFNPGTIDEDITVFTNSVPEPLTPGRWYIGVYNNSFASNVFTIVVTEYTNSFATLITLTNGIAYTNTAAAGVEDWYRYVVSSAAIRAQFEINAPSGDMTLLASRGLPLPSLSNFDYQSANPFLNDELIVIFPDSNPVPLAPGDWFLTALNVSGGPVTYSIKATEWQITGRPITIIDTDYTGPAGTNVAMFCFTWNSLPGVHYHIDANSDLTTTNWTTISPTIVAVADTTTYCVPITPDNRFFRVAEGMVVNSAAPAPAPSVSFSASGLGLSWSGGVNSRYTVEWTTNLSSGVWTPFTPNPFTATNALPPHSFSNGVFNFVDDGTQPPPPAPPQKFYRILLLP